MESLGRGPGRVIGRVPAVPGLAGVARRVPPCSACGYGDANGVLRVGTVIGGVRITLCVDWQTCCARFRRSS